MKVELRPISQIQPYPDNPRLNDQAVAAVARSIQPYGFRQPLVLDDPLYCDVVVQRWERFTGEKARRLQAAPEKVPEGAEEADRAEATPMGRVQRTTGSEVILAGGVR
jgi:hypothetical protein